MAAEDKPLSTLVSQGWEVVSYSAVYDQMHSGVADHFLLRRMKSHEILNVRSRVFGAGFKVIEIDL